jgi:hydrogenase small subunit
MAVTRREFITTLGLLATAVGMGQADLAKVTEAFGNASPALVPGVWSVNKPKVVWVHGAECTGCSTSLLSLFEDATGVAVPGATSDKNITTLGALGIVAGAADLAGHRKLIANHLNVDGSDYAVNIADVLIDFIDLQYHETVMGMGGDGAYAYLANEMANRTDATPFVLVVEGAVQDFKGGGYWGKTGDTGDAPWCSIAMDGRPEGTSGRGGDLSFDEVVESLATKSACKAVIAIGQCAAFGGYPACIGPDLPANSTGTKSQTGAKGVFDFLVARGHVDGHETAGDASNKVVNVPGCPVNPWWFTLTVVAWLVDAVTATGNVDGGLPTGKLGILNGRLQIRGGVDTQRRLTAVYGNLLHGKYCPRYPKYAARIFASKPGDDGCLKNIGCKGLSTMSLCGRHGWNAQQPQNTAAGMNDAVEALAYKSTDGTTNIGGFCMTAGAPCMGCTEKGYPDAFTPFVVR